MMNILEVEKLNKSYPTFKLDEVSFGLKEGRITGFIGRNGAGKTTTIKSLLNFVHIDSGEIRYFGKPMMANESEIKKHIGYSTGSISWYCRKKIKDIIAIVRRFYDNWDEEACRKYLKLFKLDAEKCPNELSEGMKVKVNLLIALCHRAKILILDEPTSRLDPFSRDELQQLFIGLRNEGVSIFFSTHIISDIEKCADDIIYISSGRIVCACSKEEFMTQNRKNEETLEDIFLRLERENGNDEYSC